MDLTKFVFSVMKYLLKIQRFKFDGKSPVLLDLEINKSIWNCKFYMHFTNQLKIKI